MHTLLGDGPKYEGVKPLLVGLEEDIWRHNVMKGVDGPLFAELEENIWRQQCDPMQ